ncbi:hypothetical protein V9T40_007390 [Parthenolecanium corni]|uniref:Uncharacterized protein n=1 Tax=Parthenolecanium corni TaxID=536013 RepID=A0AAN9TXB6_9HEMI
MTTNYQLPTTATTKYQLPSTNYERDSNIRMIRLTRLFECGRTDERRSGERRGAAHILNSKSLRLIREVEIYLSRFECSTKRHCNPKYDASVLLCPLDSEILVKEEASVLADATQTQVVLISNYFRATNLFEKRAKRPNVVLEVLIDSDSNDDLEPISKKTSTLTLVDDAPGYQDSPVDVPSKMSLTKFQNAPPKENVTHVKTEVVSPMKETLDKSVIHTMPLVQNDIPNIQRRC